MWYSAMTLGITALAITTISITTISIMTISITTISITTISMTTHQIMTLSQKNITAALSVNDIQHNSTQFKHSVS
jgi:hypothetical protein